MDGDRPRLSAMVCSRDSLWQRECDRPGFGEIKVCEKRRLVKRGLKANQIRSINVRSGRKRSVSQGLRDWCWIKAVCKQDEDESRPSKQAIKPKA